MVGLVVDWREYDTLYNEARLIPPKDHIPVTEEFMLYDADDERVGYATSFMYSPMLQRHIALARLRPDMAATGTRVDLEVKINHRYQRVGAYTARLPLYKPGPQDRLRILMPTSRSYDAIVIGAGHNGLINGAYLAKAGLRTLIVERRHLVGGAAITEELYPGFQFTTFSYALSLLRPDIIHELELTRFGFMPLLMPSGFAPVDDGDYLLMGTDRFENLHAIARRSAADADAYEQFEHDVTQVAQAIKPLVDRIPPDIFSKDPDELMRLAELAGHLRSLEPRVLHNAVRLLTGSAPPTSSTTTSRTSCSRATWRRPRSSAPRWGPGRRAPGWCCSTTSWASTTGPSGRGPSTREATAGSPRCWPGPPRDSAPRSCSTPRWWR